MPTDESSDSDASDGAGAGLADSSVIDKAIEVLGPRVPKLASGLVIIAIVAGVALVAVSSTKDSSFLLIVGVFFIAIAIIYTIIVLIPLAIRNRNDRRIEQNPLPATDSTVQLETLLSDAQHDTVCAAVKAAAESSAAKLGLRQEIVRGNIFGRTDDNVLRIMPGFSHNMNNPTETTVRMRVGEGSTGRSWASRLPNIALRPTASDGPDALDVEQTRRVEPSLRWVVSVPVFASDGPGGEPTWILNVDGLQEEKTLEELETLVGSLLRWAESVSRVLRSIPEERL